MASNKKQKIDKNTIIGLYMDYVLDREIFPKSVYKFCKEAKIKEEDFYQFFGSLNGLQKNIWNTFYSTSIDAIHKNKEYESFSSRDKMLTFFYTIFEMFTLNRSYILMVLEESDKPFKNIEQLKGLRRHIKSFAADLIDNDNDEKQYSITKNPVQVYSEGAWLQFLFLLKFWMDDDSAGFEKTDVAIEKSVNTIFDVFDNTPLNNILDFGKFLWKEKVMWN